MLTRKKVKDLLLDGVFFLFGSFLFAISIDTFTAPNQIAAGGLTGVATMVQSSVWRPHRYCQPVDERSFADLGLC